MKINLIKQVSDYASKKGIKGELGNVNRGEERKSKRFYISYFPMTPDNVTRLIMIFSNSFPNYSQLEQLTNRHHK